jgi:hypothetical protein
MRGGLSVSASIVGGGAGAEGVAFWSGPSGGRAAAGGAGADVGDGSARAGAGTAAGFARAGVDGFDECQKQPMDAPAINTTLIARMDTTHFLHH